MTSCARNSGARSPPATAATSSKPSWPSARCAIRRQGESRYLVEPNVKEGKGGLRDLQTLYWIGKYLYHVDDAGDLVEHGVFTKRGVSSVFQKAEAFLWNVRVHLHYLMNRAEERLSFDVQTAAGGGAGYHRSGKAAPRGRKPSCAPTSWWPRMWAT